MARPEMDLRRVPLSAVMTRDPATIEEAAPLADAAEQMSAGGFRHLPVVEESGVLVGMISERDLRARLGTDERGFVDAAADALAQPVSEAMTPDPIALPPTATLAQALEIFADDRVGAVPVVDARDRPVGIVSYVDLLGAIREMSKEASRATDRIRARRQAAHRRTPRRRKARRPR